MFKFKIIKDKHGHVDYIETSLEGNDLLNTPKLNKGCAFTHNERDQFHLIGLLPGQVETLEQQVARMYYQYQEHHSNLGKNIYLNMLHDYNETLFYKLVSEHLEEMLPIIYTPTVGEAVQRFSLEHRKPKGLYISYSDRDRVAELLENRAPPEVDMTVITDGGAVLGIGDQGIGGINISIAKLMVYTLCGGINPYRVLPIQLDVGTNNPHLLNDPMYLGWRHERISEKEYDEFVDIVVNELIKKFPHIFVHWEDMGRENARRILTRYQNQICTMNGDMQATGVAALACVLAGVIASNLPLREHRIVIFGAGTAGIGITDQIFRAMLRDGMSESEARDKIWLIDRQGLLTTDSELQPYQAAYARTPSEIVNWQIRTGNVPGLYDVVNHVKPTILIGSSTVTSAFSEEIVKIMAKHTPHPIIMPLSNPNALSEATPGHLIAWTDAQAIVATGSPFADVFYKDKSYRIAQSNNALAFPGIGLGAIATKATHITDDMLWAATCALTACSPVNQDKMAPLLPKLSEAKMISFKVALAVAEQARKDGLAQIADDANLSDIINQHIWVPAYYPYRKV